MKKSTKILLSISSILLIAGVFFILFYESNIGDQDEILLPWEANIRLNGIHYVLYYASLLQGALARYPWVVQISYLIIIGCCIAVIALFFSMGFFLTKKSKQTVSNTSHKVL